MPLDLADSCTRYDSAFDTRQRSEREGIWYARECASMGQVDLAATPVIGRTEIGVSVGLGVTIWAGIGRVVWND